MLSYREIVYALHTLCNLLTYYPLDITRLVDLMLEFISQKR